MEREGGLGQVVLQEIVYLLQLQNGSAYALLLFSTNLRNDASREFYSKNNCISGESSSPVSIATPPADYNPWQFSPAASDTNGSGGGDGTTWAAQFGSFGVSSTAATNKADDNNAFVANFDSSCDSGNAGSGFANFETTSSTSSGDSSDSKMAGFANFETSDSSAIGTTFVASFGVGTEGSSCNNKSNPFLADDATVSNKITPMAMDPFAFKADFSSGAFGQDTMQAGKQSYVICFYVTRYF